MKTVMLIICISLSIQGISCPSKIKDVQDSLNTKDDPEAFKQKLVELALLHYPTYKISKHELYKAKKYYNYNWTTWTQSIRVFYNLNDQVYNDNIVYNRPLYGVGLSLSLGDFISLPSKVKMAKADRNIASENIDLEKLNIEKEVLTRYNNYLTAIEVFKIRTKAFEDAETTYNLINQQFKDAMVSLEEYTRASQFYYQSYEHKVLAESSVTNAKILLEEMIGMSVEEARKYDL